MVVEWPKSRTLTTLNAREDAKQQELSFTAGVKGTAPVEDSLAVSYKTKHPLTISSSSHALGIYSQELKNFVVVQLLSRVQLFVTPWTAAHQTPLSFTTSRHLLKFMSIESVKIMSTQKPAQHRFITVLFIIDKAWKQPRCSSVGERIKKL